MTPVLRPYQFEAVASAEAEWAAGRTNVIIQAATGAGKTVIVGDILRRHKGYAVAIAHRQELVGQISIAMARNGVRHRIIAPTSVRSACIGASIRETRGNWIDPLAPITVAGVDTLIRFDEADPIFQTASLWVIDECHHVLRDNKWGTVAARFTNARGLGVTATPCRADGHGLGRHSDGVFDALIVGPSMRGLIDEGYLSRYRVFAPPTTVDLSSVNIGASGDYSAAPLRKAVYASRITGDAVEHYQRLAAGKLGVTFAVDVDSAMELADAYRQAGIPAAVVSAKTPDGVRRYTLDQLRRRELLQVVNVDLFGEGFDLPAIEVVSMCRPTQSYALFAQQFGRALRPLEGKDYAIIIDHVGNTLRHGMPDWPRQWSLDRREKRTRGESERSPIRVCIACTGAYDRGLIVCPYCGERWQPTSRAAPEFVDGDLAELDPVALERLRAAIDPPLRVPYGATPAIQGALKKHHRERQEAQALLREAMARWGGAITQGTDTAAVSEMQRRFWLRWGVDVLSAQALPRAEAEILTERIADDLGARP